ncbi:MAG: LysM peptidoglycan-binding domain-containing protein [Eubacterium sp.]
MRKRSEATTRKIYRKRNQFITVVIAFIVIIAGMVVGGNLLQSHRAEASNAYEKVVYYKSVEIEDGDTLWTLADQYMGDEFKDKESYIEEVKRLNHLSDDTIQAGSYLMVPYADTVSEL